MNTSPLGKIIGWSFIVCVNLTMIVLMGVVFVRFAPAKTFTVSLGSDLMDDGALDTDESFILQRYKPNLRKARYTASSPVAHGHVSYKQIELSTNAQGFRDRDHAVKKTPRTVRIAISGDSFAFGPNLNQENILSVALQNVLDRAMLEQKGPRYEVLNFGISGLNFEGMSRVTEHYALPYSPDIVLYTHICDDLSKTDVTTWAAWARDWAHVVDPLPPKLRHYVLNRLLVGLKELKYRFDDIRYGAQPELAAQRVRQVLDYIQRLQERDPHYVMFLNFCGNRIVSAEVKRRMSEGALMSVIDVTDSELDHTQHPTPRANQSNSTRILSTLNMLGWPDKILEGEVLEPVRSVGPYQDIACGYYHCCALDSEGKARCWGAGLGAPYGDPNFGQSNPPDLSFERIYAGGFQSCGLTEQGALHCWGRTEAARDARAHRPTQLSLGFLHACSVGTGGDLDCWGDNTWGQSEEPQGTFTQVAAGGDSSCAIRADKTWTCWGNSAPKVYEPSTVQAVALGDSGGCVLAEDGTPWCWSKSAAPKAAGAWTLTRIFVSRDHSCGLEEGGTVHCWGSRSSEETVALMEPLQKLSTGRGFNCGLSPAGAALCWGAPKKAHSAVLSLPNMTSVP